MQRVQACMCLGEPSTIALTRLTFGFQVLLERLCEWETLIPNSTPFPQISHLAISLHLLRASGKSTLIFYQIMPFKSSIKH